MEKTASSGIGLPGLLTVLFIGLKLTGHITWSWWWVLSPIPIAFAVALVVISVIALVLVATGGTVKRRR